MLLNLITINNQKTILKFYKAYKNSLKLSNIIQVNSYFLYVNDVYIVENIIIDDFNSLVTHNSNEYKLVSVEGFNTYLSPCGLKLYIKNIKTKKLIDLNIEQLSYLSYSLEVLK